MKDKIEYEFYVESGVPYIRSNLECNGLDMLQIVSADVGNERLVKDCIEHVKTKKVWWFNSSKIECEGDSVVITPAFDWEAEVKIPQCELLDILKKFQKFLQSIG